MGRPFGIRPDDDGGHRQGRPPRYGVAPPRRRGPSGGYAPFRGGKIGERPRPGRDPGPLVGGAVRGVIEAPGQARGGKSKESGLVPR